MENRSPFGGLTNDSGIGSGFDYDPDSIEGSSGRRATRKKSRKSRSNTRSTRSNRRKSRGLFGRRSRRGRRKSRSTRMRSGVKYTKNGQPYKIMPDGRARFIKGRRHK